MSDALSDREQQVAAALAAGLRVNAAAEELCISPVTVRNHLRSIFTKLDVHSQSEMIQRLEREPERLGPHRRIGGVGASSLVDDLGSGEASMQDRIETALSGGQGLHALKETIRTVLPLDEARRREWRTRLAAQAVADQQRDVRDAFGEGRRGWLERQVQRIAALQEEGWLKPELDPEEIRRRLFTAVFAAGGALLADPSPEEQTRQLAMIDELLASMAPDDD